MAERNAKETLEKWSDLVRQASRDQLLKRRLIANPAAVLEEHGMRVRPGCEIRVVENTDKVAYLTLPARPQDGELSTDQLEQVVGGGEFVITKYTDAATPKLY